MYLIGLLHHHKTPESLDKAYFYAVAAQAIKAELIYFSPEGVSLQDHLIKGYMLVNGSWKQTKKRFPDVIMNIGSSKILGKSTLVMEILKKEIPFTAVSIGNKLQVYERLLESQEFLEYLIPTVQVKTYADLNQSIRQYHKVVLKPIQGHRGEHIIYVENQKDSYLVLKDGKQSRIKNNEFETYIMTALSTESYLVQPYIQSKTQTGNSFHIRIHMVKNGEGKWATPILYACISPDDNIVTNREHGGTFIPVNQLIFVEYPTEKFEMLNDINQFGRLLSQHLDELQVQMKKDKFDELGIDIGIDQQHKIWLYEVNWRPGFNYPNSNDTNISENLIKYAIYVAQKRAQDK